MSDIKEKVIKRTMTSASEYNYTSTSKEITELRELFLNVKEKREALFNSEKELYNSRMLILGNMLSATTAMYFLNKIDETMNTSGSDSVTANLLKNSGDLTLLLSELKDEITRILKGTDNKNHLEELTKSILSIFNSIKLSIGLSDDVSFKIDVENGEVVKGYTRVLPDGTIQYINDAATVISFTNNYLTLNLVGNLKEKNFSSGSVIFNKSFRFEDGTKDYPFVIKSIDDLSKIQETYSHYILEKDLNLSDSDPDLSNLRLIGVFDGNGHEIKSNKFPFNSIFGEIKNTSFTIKTSDPTECSVIDAYGVNGDSVVFKNCSFNGDSGAIADLTFSSLGDDITRIKFESSYFASVSINIDKIITVTSTNNISRSSAKLNGITSEVVNRKKKIIGDSFNPFIINSGTSLTLDLTSENTVLTFFDDGREMNITFNYNESIMLNFDLQSNSNLTDLNHLPALEKVVYYMGYLSTIDRANTIVDQDGYSLSDKIKYLDYEGAINTILLSLNDAYLDIESRITSKLEKVQNYVGSYLSLESQREAGDMSYVKDFVESIINDMYNIYTVIIDTEKTDETKYSDIISFKESCLSNIRILLNDCLLSMKSLERFIREYNPFLHSDFTDPFASLSLLESYNISASENDSIYPFANIMPYKEWAADATQVFADAGYIIGMLYVIHEIGVNLCSDGEILKLLQEMSNFIVNLQIDSSCIDSEMFKDLFIDQVRVKKDFRMRYNLDVNADFLFEEINPAIMSIAPELDIVNKLDFSPYINDTDTTKIENIILMAFYKSIMNNNSIDTEIMNKIITIYSNGYLGLKDYICRDILYYLLADILKLNSDNLLAISFFKMNETLLDEYRNIFTFFVNNENGFLLAYLLDDPLHIRDNFLHIGSINMGKDLSFDEILTNVNNIFKRVDYITLERGDLNE